jgi:hypothetical protein
MPHGPFHDLLAGGDDGGRLLAPQHGRGDLGGVGEVAEARLDHLDVFHRPSEPNQDFETLLFPGEDPRKSLDVPVKWVMKNTNRPPRGR